MPKMEGLAAIVAMHHASSSAMLCDIATDGVTHKVTRFASGSEKALGSKGTGHHSSGCQITGSPSVVRAGSCLAPLAVVIRGAKARVARLRVSDIVYLG